MKVISCSGNRSPHLKNTCAAIGIFDGVHRGHQYLLNKMLATARRLHAKPIVITFFPHPAHVLRPDVKLGYLSSFAERLYLLERMGIDTCVIVRFNKTFARIEPEKFVRHILVDRLDVKAIFVGEDFRFGKDRSGDIALFKKLSAECKYEMHAMSALKQGGETISSTRIRKLISEGQFKQAEKLLDRPVTLCGEVVKGSQRGKGLGYPTANIAYEQDIIPPHGIYVVQSLLGNKIYPAVASLGIRPSFKEKNPKVLLEVYIFDFNKNIYGRTMQVHFLKKIRNEEKFADVQSLIRQMQKDEAIARRYFQSKY